ncbi:transcription antitermination factor NusB [Schaalia odontolytica]|uniref:Transcription antitermination protein NusB n=1 Tax=Schaalia odontolytica TaxID=1660 RepID=A0A2X0VFG6_9ACTO|nr:transcription antitermination factor NusB [Schaalia odontolytica]SPT56227.1 N utilization substance protein B homolog [Schaalia odontolytica]
MSKQHRFTSRTKARKRAADVVYEADQRGMGSNPDVLRDLLRERRVITAAQTPLPEFSIQIIAGVADNLRRIDSLISAHARVPGLDRIAAVDLAVMRVAVWEMLENDEVSPIIVIDEAISIVRSISTDASPRFVNAVLDAIRKDIASSWARRGGDDGDFDEAGAGQADGAAGDDGAGAGDTGDAGTAGADRPSDGAADRSGGGEAPVGGDGGADTAGVGGQGSADRTGGADIGTDPDWASGGPSGSGAAHVDGDIVGPDGAVTGLDAAEGSGPHSADPGAPVADRLEDLPAPTRALPEGAEPVESAELVDDELDELLEEY